MKKLFALVVASIVSSQAFALSSNVKVVALDDSQATNLCVVAATQGYGQAKKVAMGVFDNAERELATMTCNGMSLKGFAKKAQKQKAVETSPSQKVVKFVPAQNNEASNLCITALNEGIEAVAQVNRRALTDLYCNGVIVTKFARYNAPK